MTLASPYWAERCPQCVHDLRYSVIEEGRCDYGTVTTRRDGAPLRKTRVTRCNCTNPSHKEAQFTP